MAARSMPKYLPLLLAVVALVLTALHVYDLALALGVLVAAAVEGLQGNTEPDPTAIGQVVAQVVVTLASRGLYTVIPAVLLYIAWVPLGYRPPWLHRAIVMAGIYFMQLFPSGTVIGAVLLIALRRNRAVAS